MKHTFKQTIIFAAAMLSLAGLSSGQEIIRKFNSQPSNFSLVREQLSSKKWVVYNQQSPYFFAFGKIDSAGTTNLFTKINDMLSVKDMEIVGDTLYFCGNIFDAASYSTKAVMGYFTISGMPTPAIHYLMIDSLYSLNKLAYSMEYDKHTKHVTMIGTAKNGYDYIVDATYNFDPMGSGPWGVLGTRISDVNAKFDDIALTTNYVVASARVADSSAGYLCFIRKTTLVGGPYFMPYDIQIQRLAYSPTSAILLQASLNDTLYATYMYSDNLAVCQFYKYYNYASMRIQMPLSSPGVITFTSALVDMSMDRNYKNIDILVSILAATDLSSTFYWTYHIPVGKVASGGTIKYYDYGSRVEMFSLGKSQKNATLSVGRNSSYELELFKINSNMTGTCVSSANSTMRSIMPVPYKLIDKSHSFLRPGYTSSTISASSLSVSVTTECSSKMSEEQ